MMKLAKASLILKKITLVLGLVVFVVCEIFASSFPAGESGWAALALIPALYTAVPAFFCFKYADSNLKDKKKITVITLFILGSILLVLFILAYSLMFMY